MKNDSEYNELQEIKETIIGYFSVIGSMVIAVLFLILVLIPGLARL